MSLYSELEDHKKEILSLVKSLNEARSAVIIVANQDNLTVAEKATLQNAVSKLDFIWAKLKGNGEA